MNEREKGKSMKIVLSYRNFERIKGKQINMGKRRRIYRKKVNDEGDG